MSVTSLLSDAKAYTATLTDQASTAMDDAISSVRAIGYVIPGYYPAILPSTPPVPATTTAPTLDTVNLELPTEPPNTLEFQDISEIVAGTLPELTATSPTITLPTQPSSLAEFLQTVPNIDTDIIFPEPPSILMNPLIEAPVTTERSEPAKPTVSLPGFDAVAPSGLPAAPTDYEARYTAAYRDAAPSTIAMMDGYVDAELIKLNPQYHVQMAAIEAQLSAYLAGGTGLNAAVEDAIYSRARGKNDAENRRTQEAAWSTAAERGFTLPDGALYSALQQARQGGADNNARQVNEIVVMQAEIEQKNLQFAVTTSTGLRTTMVQAALSYHQNLITINGQALDYAKTIMSAIIEVYNTAVKAFSIQLDAYKAETMVYEVRLKAAMSYIELYQAEINALAAMVSVDRTKVEIYKAKIDALTSVANVYRAQIEAVQGRVSLEKLQLDVFQTQVQAYTAQVQAKNSEWQGYTAAIEGQTAKTRIFNTQVEAYSAQVTAYKTGIEAKVETVRAQAMTNQARAANYAATLAGYSAVVQARGEKARMTIEVQKQSIVAYTAQVQAAIGNAQMINEYYKATSNVVIQNSQLQMTAQVQTAESVRQFGQSMAQLGTANATIFGNLAGAALAGMNTLSAETLASSA